MQSRRQTRASSPSVASVLGVPTVPHRGKHRSNRASRRLNSQFVAGASRRMKIQFVAGASRRLNSQSVAEGAAPVGLGTDTHQSLRPQCVYGGKSAIGQQLAGRSWARRVLTRPRIALLQQRCLTCRSTGAPTAGHQARSGGTRYIFASPGLASCRRRPLRIYP